MPADRLPRAGQALYGDDVVEVEAANYDDLPRSPPAGGHPPRSTMNRWT